MPSNEIQAIRHTEKSRNERSVKWRGDQLRPISLESHRGKDASGQFVRNERSTTAYPKQ
jgi:hypothetical protein